jgi:hypothetical protein
MVEHLAPELVRGLMMDIGAARRRVSDAAPESRRQADDAEYWQALFEANAAAVLASLRRVRLADGHVVRYRFYERRGGDLLVRPFVARLGTDVSAMLRLLDWHPPPDAPAAGSGAAGRDLDLLYRHFEYERSAAGVFEYWVAIQELWASQRWIHSTVIADGEQLAALTAGAEWRVERPVERAEPAVVLCGDGAAQIAVLLHSPLDRHTVTFHRIRIDADQSVTFDESMLVAHGPRGYLS